MLTYMHINFEFWLWEVSVIYWERNPLRDKKVMRRESTLSRKYSHLNIASFVEKVALRL